VESARRRINAALGRLREGGLEVQARVGDPDPVVALRDAWDPARYDEIIVSTLPSRVSRWLQIDLPRRAERLTGAPVLHVEAAETRSSAAAGGAA
jgi:GABA permease